MSLNLHPALLTPPPTTILVIFGAGGDLTWRKLTPALYNLFLDHWLPERFAVIGIDRKPMNPGEFHQRMQQGVNQFSRQGQTQEATWPAFASHLSFMAGDFTSPTTYAALRERLTAHEHAWGSPAHYIFYLAIPPTLIEAVTEQLARAGLTTELARARIVVEKPFGHDLASARALNHKLTQRLAESQIYRIDHYLGKETVQNLLAFRFANAVFEPIWNRRYIDQVQITVAEQVGVEQRGGYYDQAGALRDMIQNHLLQVLCLITMEPPVSFDAEEIRNKKVDVLHALRPIPPDQVAQWAVRGQYGSGQIEGQTVPGYRQEPNVTPQSQTETYVAIKFFIDNWRWQGVPFYVRTGKRLPNRDSEIVIQFRPVPHQAFPATALADWGPNHLVIHIQPDEGIVLHFQAKHPGPTLSLSPVNMRFSYRDAFPFAPPEAYETLLEDVMQGEATLFMRADQVEAAWSVITPILEAWESVSPTDFPNYAAGTWGPTAAERLLAASRAGHQWRIPALA